MKLNSRSHAAPVALLTGVLLATLIVQGSFARTTKPKSITEILDLAYRNNPSIAAAAHAVDAEKSLITSMATPNDPVIGVSTLDRNVRTRYATINQKLRFPIKYYLQAKAQSSKAKSTQSKLNMAKLKVREKITSLYYSIYSAQKIIQLTETHTQAVKGFARVAEKKYAAGKSPQRDSMKAHFELTRLELDLIRLKQQEQTLQDKLKSVLNDSSFDRLNLNNSVLPTPKLIANDISNSEGLSALKRKFPKIIEQTHLLRETEYKSSLAHWEYLPDLQLQYQQRVSGEPEDSKIYSIGITIPLWFWKKSSEASIASSRRMVQKSYLASITQEVTAKVKELNGKVQVGVKTLNIYKTSLIPLAQGAYNSTRAAYRANKTSFLDLLDSKRSLYRVKINFYQSLQLYVESLSQLETRLGFTASTFEIKNGVPK